MQVNKNILVHFDNLTLSFRFIYRLLHSEILCSIVTLLNDMIVTWRILNPTDQST